MTESKSSGNAISNIMSSFSDFSMIQSDSAEGQLPGLFSSLSSEDQSKALHLASKIDVSRYDYVLNFGSEVQEALKTFSHNLLVQVQRNDTSPIREVLYKLMEQIEKINPDDLIENSKGFFSKLFRRRKSSIQETMSQYNRLSKQIDRLSIQLQHAQKGLILDMNMLEELFQLNEDYFHHISLFIAAGELKLLDLKNNDYTKLLNKVQLSNDEPMAKQKLSDLLMSIEWLDRKIYELQISREIAIQSAPQIRLMQQTNQMLIEKIQSSIMTTIPLWQSQISLLMNLNNQRRANVMQERLMNASDEMIRKHAKMLESTAKDSSRTKISHAEIDAFKQTQLQLIESIEETLRVQATSNEQQTALESKLLEIDQK